MLSPPCRLWNQDQPPPRISSWMLWASSKSPNKTHIFVIFKDIFLLQLLNPSDNYTVPWGCIPHFIIQINYSAPKPSEKRFAKMVHVKYLYKCCVAGFFFYTHTFLNDLKPSSYTTANLYECVILLPSPCLPSYCLS